MSAKTRRTSDGRTYFWCPGCSARHDINDSWDITGTPDNPTFSPSVLVHPSGNIKRCHSFVRAGQIEFLSDCEHELVGRTVPLPDIDDHTEESSDGQRH